MSNNMSCIKVDTVLGKLMACGYLGDTVSFCGVDKFQDERVGSGRRNYQNPTLEETSCKSLTTARNAVLYHCSEANTNTVVYHAELFLANNWEAYCKFEGYPLDRPKGTVIWVDNDKGIVYNLNNPNADEMKWEEFNIPTTSTDNSSKYETVACILGSLGSFVAGAAIASAVIIRNMRKSVSKLFRRPTVDVMAMENQEIAHRVDVSTVYTIAEEFTDEVGTEESRSHVSEAGANEVESQMNTMFDEDETQEGYPSIMNSCNKSIVAALR